MYAKRKLKTIGNDLNFDRKSASEWLKANRLSLNVKFFNFFYS